MDNASIHHSHKVAELISSVGALLIYLLPYSPDLNPIEEVFSSIKAYLKAHESIIQDTSDIKTVLNAAIAEITQEDCMGWFADSGYV
jgi:transposase